MQMQINSLKIKQLRENKCWSQQQLSDMAGISLRTLQRVESKSVASQETVKCLAAVFEVELDSLLPQQDDNHPQPSENIEVSTNHRARKMRLYRTLLIVMAANLFGLYGVFSAHASLAIDDTTFQLLKGIVSISLLFSVAAIVYKGYKQGLISFSEW